MPGWQSKSPCSRRCCSSRPMRCKHLIAGPVILPQAKPADGNPRHSVNLPMLCACKERWFRWWCLVVSKLQKQKLQSPPRKRMWIQPLRLRSNWPKQSTSLRRWCCTRTSNPRKFPKGRLNLVLWRTPRPLSPWAAPLQKRSILRSSPRLSESSSHRWPLQKPCLCWTLLRNRERTAPSI